MRKSFRKVPILSFQKVKNPFLEALAFQPLEKQRAQIVFSRCSCPSHCAKVLPSIWW
jgi:hypothetical protein